MQYTVFLWYLEPVLGRKTSKLGLQVTVVWHVGKSDPFLPAQYDTEMKNPALPSNTIENMVLQISILLSTLCTWADMGALHAHHACSQIDSISPEGVFRVSWPPP